MTTNINKLLKKKGWTGQELGIIELTNMATMFRKAAEGDEAPKPLVPHKRFMAMLDENLTTTEDKEIYGGYMLIHDWLRLKFHIAQAELQACTMNFRFFPEEVLRFLIAEDVYSYIEQLPAIMTEKQYNDLIEEKTEEYLTDQNKEEISLTPFYLVYKATSYYLKELREHPAKDNPLKAIRKLYINKPIENKAITEQLEKNRGEGYITLPDGSRSDQMSTEDWGRAVITVIENVMDQLDEDAEQEDVEDAQKKVIDLFDLKKDSAEKIKEDYNIPIQWHSYGTQAEELTKWDVIEQDKLFEIFPYSLDGEDEYTEHNYTLSLQAFYKEFTELVDVMLKDINRRKITADRIKPEQLTSQDDIITLRQLYDKNTYGIKDQAESDLVLFGAKPGDEDLKNKRVFLHGLAILRPCNLSKKSYSIDERGYYKGPTLKNTLSEFTLEAYFPESEYYAGKIENIEKTTKQLWSCYYYVLGWNISVDMVKEYFSLPSALDIFKLDIDGVNRRIDGYNSMLDTLKERIEETDYSEDPELKKRKLQVLEDIFPPLDYTKIKIPEENIKKAKELFKNFRAFSDKNMEFDYYMNAQPNIKYGGEEDETE